jgi:GTP cyclohydrolase I
MKTSSRRAAEMHGLAAHAHEAAAVHHGKGDHQTGQEHSKQAMEYSAKAFLASIGADQNAEPIRKTPKVAGKKK